MPKAHTGYQPAESNASFKGHNLNWRGSASGCTLYCKANRLL